MNNSVNLNGTARDVARELKKKGYEIAGYSGDRIEEPFPHYVGILKLRGNIHRFGFSVKQPGLYLGTLFFNGYKISPSSNGKWTLLINGRDNIDSLTKTVIEIADKYGVDVVPKLVSEKPRFENDINDYVGEIVTECELD